MMPMMPDHRIEADSRAGLHQDVSLQAEDHEDIARERVIAAAATLFAESPFVEVTLHDIAEASGDPASVVTRLFPTIRALAAVILDVEGASMREAQQAAARETDHPLKRLRRTFQLVGENMAFKEIVRAGMRLAIESRQHFPERRIDPFGTWHGFVITQLTHARDLGMLKPGQDINVLAWMLVAIGMGTKELVAFRGAWEEIPERLDATLSVVLDLIADEVR